MKRDYAPPIITIAEDPETGEFQLMATSHSRTQPAGDRLLRIPFGAPWPVIAYVCPTQAEAETNAATLRHALANPPKKTGKGSEEADSTRTAITEAVWNL